MPDHPLGILRLSIDAGTHGGAPDVHLPQPLRGFPKLLAMTLHRPSIGREFLAQADRCGILEVGAPRLHDRVELHALGQQRVVDA